MQNVIKLSFAEVTAKAAPTPKPSKTFTRHAARLKGRKALTENEIKALCWALNGVKRVNLNGTERARLLELLDSRQERPISKAQTAKGLEWLKRLAFKADGSTRDTKDFPFGDFEIEVLRNFARFSWLGVHNALEDQGYYDREIKAYMPVWRVHAKDGSSFDYYVSGQWGRVVVC